MAPNASVAKQERGEMPVRRRRHTDLSERDSDDARKLGGSIPESDSSESSDDSDEGPRDARVAQWQGEEEDSVDADEIDKGEGPSRRRQQSDPADFGSLSFGSLLKARRILEGTHTESDATNSEDDDTSASGSDDEEERMKTGGFLEVKKKVKPEKRAHKHAPTEVTSKRPVTRRRQVVTVQKVTPRDPRFSSTDGAKPDARFKQQYAFLDDLHVKELKTLKDSLKRAEKLLRSSPRELRQEREEEVERLMRTVKRAESSVNSDRQQAIEISALQEAQKKEREGQKTGKKAWYMKDSEKRDMLLKARHDFLKETGGRVAVRKAIERKQKKTSQRDKKQIPTFSGRQGPVSTPEEYHKVKKRRIA